MATHTNTISGLGELLRCARERRGLTLEQISNETKIPRRHLQALEQDDASAIPVEFYRRAAIRAYARAVRLDLNLVLAEVERAPSPPAREPDVESVRAQKPTLFRKQVLVAIGVLLVTVGLGRVLVERKPAHDTDAQVRSARSRDIVKPAPETVSGAAVSQPALGVPAASPLPPSGTSPAAAIETTRLQASAASNGDLALTAGEGEASENDAAASAELITELIVSVQPEGARVTVNGIGWGTAPVTIRYLPAGQKRIRVTKDGYTTEERIVRLVEGHPTMVDIQLHSAP
jgi:cytoskeleton protein RodZ